MTVIAYRNGILACDRCVSCGSAENQVNKMYLKEVGEKQVIIVIEASLTKSFGMMNWYLDGAEPPQFNCFKYSGKSDKDKGGLVIWDGENLIEYENSPVPIVWTGADYFAFAWGMEAALGAMFMGGSAIDAVRAANRHCSECGSGVNFVDVRTTPYVIRKTE